MDLLLGKDSGGSGSAVGYCPSKICLFCQFIHKTWVIWRRKGKDLLDLLISDGVTELPLLPIGSSPAFVSTTLMSSGPVSFYLDVSVAQFGRTLRPRFLCMFRFSADELWCHFLTPTAVALLQWPYCSGPTAVAGRGSLLDFIAQFWQLSMKLSMFCWAFQTVLNILV